MQMHIELFPRKAYQCPLPRINGVESYVDEITGGKRKFNYLIPNSILDS